jgi:hypothetical protein
MSWIAAITSSTIYTTTWFCIYSLSSVSEQIQYFAISEFRDAIAIYSSNNVRYCRITTTNIECYQQTSAATILDTSGISSTTGF